MGLLGATLLLVRGASVLTPRPKRRLAAAAALVVALVPIAGIPVAGYLRGVTGELSMTTLVLLVLAIFGRPAATPATSGYVLAAAACLYPAALGLGPFDPYSLGFRPVGLLLVLGAVFLLSWWQRWRGLLLCVLAAAAGYALQLLESGNLWDYVVDPWITLYAIYDLRPIRRKS